MNSIPDGIEIISVFFVAFVFIGQLELCKMRSRQTFFRKDGHRDLI